MHNTNTELATDKFRLAVIQMVSGPEFTANLASAARLLTEAARGGAQIAALPEFFPCIGLSGEKFHDLAEQPGHGPLQTFLSKRARQHNLWLVGGTIPLRSASSPTKVHNSMLVFDPQGQLVVRYDKIHLFNYHSQNESWQEGENIDAGHTLQMFDAAWGRTALAVCYDLRFPELFRSLGAVNLMALPSAFTVPTGQAHWEVLLRARAIENQCYVMAPAQGGQHPSGRQTYGHSMIVDPWGRVLDCLPTGEGVVLADLDLACLLEIRQKLPALDNRRQDLFPFLS